MVGRRQSDGNAGFLRAARDGHLDDVLDYLKGSTDINTSNPNGLNALHLASKEGHINIVNELLKRGANVEAATKKGNTALHIASLAGHENIVVTLVDNGAQVNLQAQAGFTPLYMASQEGHADVVKFLLATGANQGLATEDGFTPLAVALQQGHDKVVSVLLEHDSKGKVRLPALHIAAKKDDVKSAALLLQNEQNSVELQTKSGYTPLHIAARYGNTNVASLLIQRNADVNFRAKNNITPLHVGSSWGKLNMVNLLLDNNATIDEKTRDGLTPLHCAARSGHNSVTDVLLEQGAPHSAKTKNGLTPLHMAAQGDHEDCARLLLYHKASLNEVTVDYLTPLHVAAHCGNVKTAKLLLDRKCEPDARALNGFTPLHIACKKNRIKVVELLLKYGASIESKTESGLTPLHVASFMGHMNIVIYLIQHNANPNTATVRGETSLHLAARANQSDIIRILMRNGATVDARAREQQTPLHIAARLGNVDNVVLLLQHGADVDATTKDKYTPLHIAAKEGHDEVAQVLLEHEAHHDVTTKKGFTPLHIAAKYGNIKVARMLLQKDANPDIQGKNGLTPLHVATHYNHANVAQLLLESKANPHATAKNGYTPLHIAAKKNQMDIATMLLEYGAKPNAESKNGFTPLHLAAQEGHTDIVSLLLQKDANVNAQAQNGLTPMHLAAQEDKVPVAEILKKYGGEIDPKTKAGYTPLHTACHFGQINMVRFLLDKEASVNATTKVGYTPLHQAAQQGHVQVVSLLLKHQASPNAVTNNGQTPLAIAQKLGYISVVEILKPVTEVQAIVPTTEDKYKVVSPETMQEHFISDSEDEGEGNRSSFISREDSISLDRGGSASPLDTSFDKEIQMRHPHQESRGRQVSQLGATMHYPSYLEHTPNYEEEFRYYHGDTLSPKDKSAELDKSRLDSVFGDSTLGRDSVNMERSRSKADSTDDIFEDEDMKYSADDPYLNKKTDPFSEDLYARQSFRYGLPPASIKAQEAWQGESPSPRPGRSDVVYQGPISASGSVDQNSDSVKFPLDDSVLPAADAVDSKEDYMDAQITSQSFNAMYSAPPPTGRLPVGPEANRFSSYSGSSFSTSFDPDNVPVDRSPVYSGFLISFMVDARGGAMRGCRHPGVRFVIPPRKCSMPTRITCRLVKKEKLAKPPPMLEGEGLAARILEMGPQGTKFLGPILLEVPHFASLRGKEREVVILRSDNGESWYEHPMQATEDAVAEALGSSSEGGPDGSQASVSSLWKLDPEEDLSAKRIKRILTSDLPMYFALVSRVTRVKQESTLIGNEGGVLSSNVVPQVQAVLPEGTLTRPINVSLQAQPIAPELVAKLLGNRVAVSPIVTVEPRRRKFHKPITLTIPVPRAAQKGMINQYNNERPTLRLLFCLAADNNPAVWEDVTDSKPMTLVDDCVSFTTTVTARFWLIDCQNVAEAADMASMLYQEAVTVPYMAKFVVFAKRDSPEEGKLRVFCMTDDKDDKTLEKQEKFYEVARSKDIEVLEGRPQFVEMAGNLIPVTKSGYQLHVNFRAFRENRLPCTVKIRDQDQEPSARVAFMKEPKVARGQAPQTPICNLNIRLPDIVASDSGELDSDKAAELRKRHEFLRGQGIVIQDTVNRAEMKLSDIADTVQGDWVMLAQQLQISMSDINHIKTENKTVNDQALEMLHLWVQKNGSKATGNELETALRKINRDDVVRKCMHNVERVDDDVEAAEARALIDQSDYESLKDGSTTKDSMKRGMSLDVQYDEQDMIKESESAAEESPSSDKGQPPGPAPQAIPEATDSRPTSMTEEVLQAVLDQRRPVAKAAKTPEQDDAESEKRKQAYIELAMQMDQFADLQDAKTRRQDGPESERAGSVSEDEIVRTTKTSSEEAFPSLRTGVPSASVESEKPHVTFSDQPDRGITGVTGEVPDHEEEVLTPPPSPTEKFQSEEPVHLAENSIAEAATRLASEAADDFDSEGQRRDGAPSGGEVMYSRAEVVSSETPSGPQDASSRAQLEPSSEIVSPMSDGGSSCHDEPSPVPEPTLPEDFHADELAYEKHEEDVDEVEDGRVREPTDRLDEYAKSRKEEEWRGEPERLGPEEEEMRGEPGRSRPEEEEEWRGETGRRPKEEEEWRGEPGRSRPKEEEEWRGEPGRRPKEEEEWRGDPGRSRPEEEEELRGEPGRFRPEEDGEVRGEPGRSRPEEEEEWRGEPGRSRPEEEEELRGEPGRSRPEEEEEWRGEPGRSRPEEEGEWRGEPGRSRPEEEGEWRGELGRLGPEEEGRPGKGKDGQEKDLEEQMGGEAQLADVSSDADTYRTADQSMDADVGRPEDAEEPEESGKASPGDNDRVGDETDARPFVGKEKHEDESDDEDFRGTSVDSPYAKGRDLDAEKDSTTHALTSDGGYAEERGPSADISEVSVLPTGASPTRPEGLPGYGFELRAELGDEEFVDRSEEMVVVHTRVLSREQTPSKPGGFMVTLPHTGTAPAIGEDDANEVFDGNFAQGEYKEEILDDGTIIKRRNYSITADGNNMMELVKEEGPAEPETKVEDTEEILPDGTVHRTHKVHKHSLKRIRKTLRSEDGTEEVTEETEEVPGTVSENVVETFDEPPKMVHDENVVEEVLSDGTRIHKHVVMNRMVHHIRTHQQSFDSEGGVQEEEYEVEEVIPGTQSAFLAGSDTDTSEEDDDIVEEAGHSVTDIEEKTEVKDDGSIVTSRLLTTETTRKVRSRSGSVDESEVKAKVEEEEVTPSPRPRSPTEDPYNMSGKETVKTTTTTAHMEETRKDATIERTLEVVEDMVARGALTASDDQQAVAGQGDEDAPQGGDRGAQAGGDDGEVQTHRLMMKKEVHKKTTIGPDGREVTTVREDSQVQQENEPPEELRDSMQEIIDQFMETTPQPPQLPPAAPEEDEV